MKHKRLIFILAVSSAVLLSCNKVEKVESKKDVGVSANDMLSDTKFKSIKVEIQYMTGFVPDAYAIELLKTFLADRVNKSGGITIVQKEIPASTNASLNQTQINDLEKTNRTVYNDGTELGIYLLITNGGYATPGVLGVAYYATSICLFGKTINDNSGAIVQVSRTKLTATVLEHEFGHLMGLVNVGSTMQIGHNDSSHGSHCNNDQCLMYWAAETTDILGFLMTGNIPDLDANCKTDLIANGGK